MSFNECTLPSSGRLQFVAHYLSLSRRLFLQKVDIFETRQRYLKSLTRVHGLKPGQRVPSYVTRIGKFSPLWHNFKTFRQCFEDLFNTWQNFECTLIIFNAVLQNSIVVNVQILKNKLAIWSHCSYLVEIRRQIHP